MRTLTCFLILSFIQATTGLAQTAKSIDIMGTKLYYHYFAGNTPGKKLVLFLHGSVRAFQEKAQSEAVETNILLESNKDFIPTFTRHGYDIIMPISFNEYNWLEKGGMVFIDSLLNQYAGRYADIYISGFSDGGTGAYRQFYGNNAAYRGVMIFNGYPQLNNFYRSVKYEDHRGKKVFFYAQESDKVVPFEFLLTEYRRQKITNAETYFFLKEGKHEFVRYSQQDFEELIFLLEQAPVLYTTHEDSMWVFPPLDALLIRDSVQQVYRFRSRVCKGYGMKAEEYQAVPTPAIDRHDQVFPLQISKTQLRSDYFLFPAKLKGKKTNVNIRNYLAQQAW